jgi:GxxExxY protein
VTVLARPSALVEQVIGCAIEVHRTLGPGLLESSYEACLVHELMEKGLPFRRQVPVPIDYKGVKIRCGYRLDLLVEDTLALELKSVDQLSPIHQAQMLTYLKLLDLHQGFVINFNELRLVNGLRSVLR